MSTNVERTEDAIRWAMSNGMAGNPVTPGLIQISRDLALKLDRIASELDGWDNQTADAIRAIIEGPES